MINGCWYFCIRGNEHVNNVTTTLSGRIRGAIYWNKKKNLLYENKVNKCVEKKKKIIITIDCKLSFVV